MEVYGLLASGYGDWPIIKQIAWLLGQVMNGIFNVLSKIGIENIGVCIIIFTIIIYTLMIPLTIKQQKFSKMSAVMQPEIKKIQKKYEGKKDQATMMKQQEEINLVYEKYGTSMTGGCLPMLIQMPILFALYQVIYHIPAYVSSVKDVFMNVVTSITSLGVDHVGMLTQFATDNKVNMAMVKDMATNNGLVDFLYQLNPTQWSALQDLFPSIQGTIVENAAKIEHMNSFLGINLASTPFSVMFPNGFTGGFHFSLAILIPILAGLSQWLSASLMTVNQPTAGKDDGNSMAQSMKMMNTMMPLMSVFFCFTFASGIGIYWVAQSVFTVIQQMVINSYLNKVDMDELVQKNVEKTNKKRAKKGLPPTKVGNVDDMLKKYEEKESREESARMAKIAKSKAQVEESNKYYNQDAKPGSLASKAGMVAKYNERQEKGNKK